MHPSAQLANEYSAKAHAYAQCWSPVIHPMALPLIERLPLRTARRIVDIGAGTGAFLRVLQQAAPAATVVGVDRAEGMLRMAPRNGPPRLAVMDGLALGLAEGACDVVTAIFVLFHLPDPPQGLREMYRVLRGGGSAGIAMWGSDPGQPGMTIWREELDRAGAAPDPRDPSVMQQALMDTRAKLDRLMKNARFATVETWSRAFVHRFAPDSLIALQASCGMPARRLASLPADRRDGCIARVRDRLSALSLAELEYRPEVLFAVGVKHPC